MKNDYAFEEDLSQAEASLGISRTLLAQEIKVSPRTLANWENGSSSPSEISLESFYSFLYHRGVRLNDIKAQLYEEENEGKKILFHGSKNGIIGPLSLEKSQPAKDFGKGFYCGENLEQSVSFVASLPSSSAYILSFDEKGLKGTEFSLDQQWMLSIAFFRGRLEKYANHPLLQQIQKRILSCDYVKAPFADNRMFEIIGEFIDGEITDEQCKHCLSATDLGKQYVFLTPKALDHVQILEHCYLAKEEKDACLKKRGEIVNIGADKVKIARSKYKGMGCYIEEILK
jgi:transcriptional regulator with XRE-family HTH domain